MPLRDIGLILIVVLAWGTNFSAMKIALEELPPFLFVSLRFAILLPLLVILPRPQIGWRKILCVGLFINMGQFGFLFAAMRADASAGLSSLLIQTQAPLTILFSALFLGERVLTGQIIGMCIAVAGILLIASSTGGSVTALGVGLILCAALSWAIGNMILKGLGGQPMLPIFIWASLIPPLPMLALSLGVESGDAWQTIAALSAQGWAAVTFVAYVSTAIGYSLWGTLMSRHAAATVTPYALLIPVCGITAAALILGEWPGQAEWIGVAIILSGLAMTQITPLLDRRKGR